MYSFILNVKLLYFSLIKIALLKLVFMYYIFSRVFGFVARKPASHTDNQCHLFAEFEPEQPASAIVNFVTKVMMTGTQQNSQMV